MKEPNVHRTRGCVERRRSGVKAESIAAGVSLVGLCVFAVHCTRQERPSRRGAPDAAAATAVAESVPESADAGPGILPVAASTSDEKEAAIDTPPLLTPLRPWRPPGRSAGI